MAAGLPGAQLAAVFRGATEVFIRDLVAQDTVLVSVGRDGERGGGRSFGPSTPWPITTHCPPKPARRNAPRRNSDGDMKVPMARVAADAGTMTERPI